MASPPQDNRRKKTGEDDVVDDGANTIKLWGVEIPIGRDDGGDQGPVNIHSSSSSSSSSSAAGTHHHQEIPEVETIFPAGNLIDQDLMKNKNSSSTRSAGEGSSSSSSSATTGNIIARTPIKIPPLSPIGRGFLFPPLFRKKLITGDIRRLKVPNVDGFWDSLQFALTEEEKAELSKNGFIRVSATDATNANYQLHLSTVPQKSVAYVLGNKWHKFFKDNKLTLGDTVEAWAYHTGEVEGKGDLHLQLTFTKEKKSVSETEMESCSTTRSCFCS